MVEPHKRKVENRERPAVQSIPINLRPDQVTLAHNRDQVPQPTTEKRPLDVGDLKGVYIISVAARILEMHPQTLRKYERLGLIRPFRTIGMLRLYSQEDIEKLRLIKYLEETLGLNLAGVEFTLNLLTYLLQMLQRISTAEESERVVSMVEQEMAELFRNLNLPISE